MKIKIADEELILLPQKSLQWPRAKMLVLSDLHLGKAESLQAQGIPLPSGAHQADLQGLSDLIHQTQPERVLILGDFIHNPQSWSTYVRKDLEIFFKEHHFCDFMLLLGNHERGSVPELTRLPMKISDKDLIEGPFRFCHGHTQKKDQYFQIQGHVHPVVNMKMGSTRLRLPCFVLEEDTLTLPSFGTLTGGFEIRPRAHQQVFVVSPQEVFPL